MSTSNRGATRYDIDEVKRAAGRRPFDTLSLKKKGSSYWAHCPFHPGDSDPSFKIDQKNGVWVWYCHGCGKNGNVIDFVMQRDGLDFAQALRKLADESGVQPDHRDRDSPPVAFEVNRERAAARLGEAKSFLEARGISLEVAERHGLGGG
jgi:DNA primase